MWGHCSPDGLATPTQGNSSDLPWRKGFHYGVSALFSCPQLEALRWAVCMNKERKVFRWGPTGVTALWEEQVPHEVVKTSL